jgi:valyl-tRNA synthetase
MNLADLPKQYEHTPAQARCTELWQQHGYFHAVPDPKKKPFTIVIPPPNVTGALHLGHALNNTLQDILIRWKRMQGFNTLWMPGTDHAGIATQAVVEKRLREEEKLTRHDLGREKLVERIWQWKAQYETRITGQLQQMGCSCDWERQRFTLDDMCARAVRHTFFKMFADGKIYRGKRLVNWDCFLQTAVSDDEVNQETIKGHFWHFKYPVVNPAAGEPTHVIVATTRPETMLGDTAVAVHPDPAKALDAVESELRDKLAAAPAKEQPDIQKQLDALAERRTTHLPLLIKLRDMAKAGRKLMLPLQNREIPLVCDDWAKPELGSGCVKITPAHDPNDYEVGKRCALPMINILNPDGTLNNNAGAYQGLTLKKARTKVVEDLDALGLLDRVEDREIPVPMSDRSKTPIEPYLADQWFVKMDELAQSAMDAVTDGRVKIQPERYAKSYLDWLSEKRDWPVSRQLWWGHRIPIWYCTEVSEDVLKKTFANRKDVAWKRANEQGWLICAQESDLKSDAVPGATITQDPDVLDTWFSSALWPHSTLGWPEQTPELEYFYPTSVLVTSRDIITLWVARMVLTGFYNVGKIPFSQVFIHPKILDGFGETMSKSKGNGVDPLDVISMYGADSLRFGLAYMATETQDVRMPVEFVCPHCGKTMEQTLKNRVLPKIACPACNKEFSTQWAKDADAELPRGPVTSERFAVARNFCNKLWNASRFAMLNLEGFTAGPINESELLLEDRWLLSRLNTVTQQVTTHLEQFRFAEAARTLYDFAWDDFCSFYVEMIKTRLTDEGKRTNVQRLLAYALDVLLRLLHPITPFVTEEVWALLNQLAPERGLSKATAPSPHIIVAPWPVADSKWIDTEIEERFTRFQAVLGALREIRSRQNIAPRTPIKFGVKCEAKLASLLEPMSPYFQSMAGATATGYGPNVVAPVPAANTILPGCEIFVDMAGLIDVAAEVQRITKELEKVQAGIKGKESKLNNEGFVARAPANVVTLEREQLAELQARATSLNQVLADLNKMG